MSKGTIYRDRASKGIKCGKQVHADRWVAEITISGKRKRKRSQNLDELKAWLQLMEAESAKEKERKAILRKTKKIAKPKRKPKPKPKPKQKPKALEIPSTFRPIIDLPKYWMDMTDGVVYRQYKKRFNMINITTKDSHSSGAVVCLRRNNKPYHLSYPRLRLAVEKKISYFIIPKDIIVLDNGGGKLILTTYKEQGKISYIKMKKKRQETRMERLEEYAHEIEIIRRAYSEGSHIEVAQYIESRKGLFIGTMIKRIHCSEQTADICYALALEYMITRIDDPSSLVTKLTTGMMSYMRSTYYKLMKERALQLNNEVASNSYNMYNY